MADTDRIRIGGLMRCCIESIQAAPGGREGDVIPCKYHPQDGDQARFTDGAWEWIRPAELDAR